MKQTHWIKQVTPFIILAALGGLAFIYFVLTGSGVESMGYKYFVLPLLTLTVIILIDFTLKRLVKLRLLFIWLIELFLTLGLIYWWIIS